LNRYYTSDCYEIDDRAVGGLKEKLYLGGDFYTAPAVYVKDGSGNWQLYYIFRDYQGSITHIANSSGSVMQELSYDAWGQLRNPDNQIVYEPGSEPELFLGRGYTGHEHLTQLGLINMNARLYDPALGRFLSPDPYVQMPDFSQSYNRYTYCLNNPFKYTDPSGEFFWIIPNISWSKKGGFSIGISFVVGIPGIASVQTGVGYNFKGHDAYAYAGATAAFNTVYVSASTSSGFSAGWSAGISPQMGFPISTNFTSAGVNYNISHNRWSGNISAWGVDKSGWTFNPSVSVMFLDQQATNLVRGQGFRSNNQVLSRFVANGQQQRALDYFGFKGTYEPNAPYAGEYVEKQDYIRYNNEAFIRGYDYLLAVYMEESFHQSDISGLRNTYEGESSFVPYEEWRAKNYLLKNSGLFSKSGVNWENSISSYGYQAGIYDFYNPYVKPWWRFIYKIPRRW